MLTTVIELTDDQKIAILEGAKELLGPNGENWTKACWWGRKYTEDEVLERLDYFGYDLEDWERDATRIDEEVEYEISRASLSNDDSPAANTWCLMGALEEAAFRLGITPSRNSSERLARTISLQNLVDSNEEWNAMSVIDVNDNPSTTFDTIRDLIDTRLAQLRS